VWLGLNGTDLESWIVGGPVVLAAAALGVALRGGRRPRLRWVGLLPFAVFFLLESVRGGWDVARRVFHPRLPVAPGFVRIESSLPEGAPRVLFVNVVSLLPGTVGAGLVDDRVVVHAIDVNARVESALRDVERRVAALFVEEREDGR
jgi:multicomponent Na+:H+ antiporter subunit E